MATDTPTPAMDQSSHPPGPFFDPEQKPEEASSPETGSSFSDQVWSRFNSVQAHLSQHHAHLVVLAGQNPQIFAHRPFLTLVHGQWFDPFLKDQAPVKVNIFAIGPDEWVLQRLTFNRRILAEVRLDWQESWPSRLDAILASWLNPTLEIRVCPGFAARDEPDLFQKLRKVDIPFMNIENFANETVYRARTCQYVIENGNDSDRLQCSACFEFHAHLVSKYVSLSNTLIETTSKVIEEEMVDPSRPKRGRGRPRKQASSEVDPSNTEDVESMPKELMTIKLEDDEGKENLRDKSGMDLEDDSLAMKDDPQDEDFESQGGVRLRRGKKRASATRFNEQMALFVKRKRGRPPTITDPVTCSDCGETFTVLKDFRLHCQEHANKVPCEFPDCTRRLKNHRELDIHMRKHRGEKPFACSECDKAYLSRQDLRTHMRSHTGLRPFPCQECPKRFARYQQLKIHMTVHTGEKAFLCPECGGAFGSDSTLIDHRKRKHLEIRDYKCDFCPKGFFTRQERISHMRTHTGDKPFPCSKCGKAFSREHHLKRHMKGVHFGDKQKQYFYRKSDTPTVQQPSLNSSPMKGYSTIKMVEALEDNDTVLYCTDESGNTVILQHVTKDFNSDQYIVSDDSGINIKNGERPYHCAACGKDFGRLSALRIHKSSVHEKIKSYLCPECGAAFKSNSALIDHRKRVHLSVKPHRCDFCRKEFFSKKDFTEHVRIHTGEKPFQCQQCGKRFGRQNHVKRHVQSVHKGVKVEGNKRLNLESELAPDKLHLQRPPTSTDKILPFDHAAAIEFGEVVEFINFKTDAAQSSIVADPIQNDAQSESKLNLDPNDKPGTSSESCDLSFNIH